MSGPEPRVQVEYLEPPEAIPRDFESRVLLRRYLTMKDDNTDRAKRVTLDRRRFGPSYSTLPKSKILGW